MFQNLILNQNLDYEAEIMVNYNLILKLFQISLYTADCNTNTDFKKIDKLFEREFDERIYNKMMLYANVQADKFRRKLIQKRLVDLKNEDERLYKYL